MSRIACSPCLSEFCYPYLHDVLYAGRSGVNDFMKKLLILPLLILLAGCVTYYYPETALEDGVYYAEDDPSYVLNSGDYSGVVYYPWSSLDYFYLGYWPYPGYGFVHGYPFGLGYSPWDFPNGYYGYYSPRYFSHHYGSYWRPYRGYCPGVTCNRHYNRNRYTMGNNGHRRNRNPEDEVSEVYTRVEDSGTRRNSSSPVGRYVTTAPPGYSGNKGMVIRSRENSKTGKSRLEPSRPGTSKPVRARSSTTGVLAGSPATSSVNMHRSRSAVVSSPSTRQSSGKSITPRRRVRD